MVLDVMRVVEPAEADNGNLRSNRKFVRYPKGNHQEAYPVKA